MWKSKWICNSIRLSMVLLLIQSWFQILIILSTIDVFALILTFKNIALNIIFLDYWHLSALLNFASRHPSFRSFAMFCVYCVFWESQLAASTWMREPPVLLAMRSVAALPTGRRKVEGSSQFWLSHCLDHPEEALLDNHYTTKMFTEAVIR